MNVLDLFAGTGSSTQPFADRGHYVYTVELDESFEADLHADIFRLKSTDLPRIKWDFIWASPPCTCFSVASISTHWTGGRQAYVPRTRAAFDSILLVGHTLRLIAQLNPTAWVMENPRGVLRKLDVVKHLPRRTVTYCAYGDERMKPTDLFGYPPANWTPRPMCKNGDPCHEAAPRGSKTGTQGRANAKERSRVPYELGLELCLAMETAIKEVAA